MIKKIPGGKIPSKSCNKFFGNINEDGLDIPEENISSDHFEKF